MKINSMEAITKLAGGSGQSSPAPATKTTTGSDMPAVSSTDDVTIRGRSLSTLSEAERRELPVQERVVIDAIERANKAMSGGDRKFEFSVHQKTKQIVVKVIDSNTNEVVREIPSEKILDMVAKMWEMSGIMVDERR